MKLKADKIVLGVIVTLGVLFWTGVTVSYMRQAHIEKVNNQTTQTCNVDAQQLLASINNQRAKLGAPALVIDSDLAASSKAKLDDMVNGKYFGHNRLDGSSWSTLLDRTKVTTVADEDIEFGQRSPQDQWEDFRNSPAHYNSLINPKFTRIGISTDCINYPIEHPTGPVDNTDVLGQKTTSLTVVHLAEPEPSPTPKTQTRYVPAPSSGYSTTHCYDSFVGSGVTCDTTSY